jgi:serine/threonine-protein kinase SRK2
MRAQAKTQLKEDSARKFFQQLIIAVDYCHKRGIANLDVSMDNTLVQVIAHTLHH